MSVDYKWRRTERPVKPEIRRISYAFFVPAVFVFILWVCYILEWEFDLDWYRLGVYPRTLRGLLGIITEPLIHSGLKHLFSNSVPLLVLGWCLFYFYKDLGYPVFALIWIISGFLTWCIGRESWHIGASGLIYGLSFFLFFSGVFRRYIPLLAISMLVVFLYGSMIWNMFPISELVNADTSWEGHLSGALSGLLCAVVFRKSGPQRPTDPFENEEDEEENEEEETNNDINI